MASSSNDTSSSTGTSSATPAAPDAPGALVQDDGSGRIGLVVGVSEPDADGVTFPLVAWLSPPGEHQLPVTVLRP